MNKLFEKNEVLFSIVMIVIYVVSNSYIMQNFGVASLTGMIVNLVIAAIVFGIICILDKREYLGLKKVENVNKSLFFIPLLVISSVNLWNGITFTESVKTIIYHVISMCAVGFLEEVIFRGFLFKAMAKDNIKSAVIVTSLTFGIGHIVNLLNGADLVPTLIQICYAVTLGYLFVTIAIKNKSILPGIIAHMCINATSIFGVEGNITMYVAPIALVIISLSYATYINKNIKE